MSGSRDINMKVYFRDRKHQIKSEQKTNHDTNSEHESSNLL